MAGYGVDAGFTVAGEIRVWGDFYLKAVTFDVFIAFVKLFFNALENKALERMVFFL